MASLEILLAQHPFLEGFPPEQIKLLAGCATEKNFSPDQVLFHELDQAREFYLIRYGTVAMQLYRARKGPVVIQTRGEGEVVGWLGLPPPYQWNFDARALELTRTIALDAAAVLNLCDTHPQMGYELLKRFIRFMARHFKMMKLQLVDMYGD
jgi:CRP-like cAMP-binding protein